MTNTVPTIEDFRFNAHVELTVINCGKCGGTYAINERHRKDCQTYGRSWTCPYCKTGWGYEGSKVDRLQQQLDEERRRREHAQQSARLANENAEHQRRVASGYKGQLARTKKRIGNGICPCCNRTFRDLQRHMSSKHPEYPGKEGRHA